MCSPDTVMINLEQQSINIIEITIDINFKKSVDHVQYTCSKNRLHVDDCCNWAQSIN